MEAPSVRQRSKKRSVTPSGRDREQEPLIKTPSTPPKGKGKPVVLPSYAPSQAPYTLAFVVITGLAFVTRFWMINHPNEVVFDEVHFGKVRVILQILDSVLTAR